MVLPWKMDGGNPEPWLGVARNDGLVPAATVVLTRASWCANPSRWVGLRLSRRRLSISLTGGRRRKNIRPGGLRRSSPDTPLAEAGPVATELVILATEGNLDLRNGADIIRLLEALRVEGCMAIVVTHDESPAAPAG
jgi:hypothetical protein